MYSVLLSLYLIVSILLIGLILLQHGKGASMGASFGAGASNTVYGSVGSGNSLTHSTAVLATLFFLISLGLTALYARQDNGGADFENLQSVADQAAADRKTAQEAERAASDLPTENASVGLTGIDGSAAGAGEANGDAKDAAAAPAPAPESEVKDSVLTEGALSQDPLSKDKGGAALQQQIEAEKAKAQEQAAALQQQIEAEKSKVHEQAAALQQQVEAEKAKVQEQAAALQQQVEAEKAKVQQQAVDLQTKVQEAADAAK